MKAQIVRIGNSRGVRIPKVLLEETGLNGEVELVADGNKLVIRPPQPARHPREGWAEAFAALAGLPDELMDEPLPMSLSSFDEEEWEWE